MNALLFKHPHFMRFWSSQFTSFFAAQMVVVTVGWQMYDLTHNPLDLGLIGLFQFLPQFLLTLVAGYVADNYNRKRIATICQLIACGITLVLAFSSFHHVLNKELLLICASTLGAARAFESPSMQSLLPTLLEPALLPTGLTWRSASVQAGIVLGPALGGFIYIAGPHVVYATSALFFFTASQCVRSIHTLFTPTRREPVTFRSVLGGIHYIRHNPVILGAISLDLFSVLLGGAVALLPIYARDILHVGSEGLGALRAAPAVGALLMSTYILRHPLTQGVGKTLFIAVAIYGCTTIIFGLSHSFLLSLAALMISGAADMISVVVRSSLVQLETPNEMRGRVSAVNSIFIGTSNQLGEFESGITAAWWGTVPAVVAGGIGTLLIVFTWTRLFPSLLARDTLKK